MTRPVGPDNVGEYLVSARSFEEYRAMFALTGRDLAGAILDCPGGGSGFAAGAGALGAAVTAVDPVYALAAERLGALVLGETERGSAHTGSAADRYVWDYFGDLDGHRAVRAASAAAFAADLVANPHRYRAGSLPALPFADRSFDLVLSSHLLFTYADRLDAAFHVAALRELLRVCRGEVRVFPLLDQAGGRCGALLGRVLAELAVPAEVRVVDYEFQRGGNELLVLTPPVTP